jgi:hypothetical protein
MPRSLDEQALVAVPARGRIGCVGLHAGDDPRVRVVAESGRSVDLIGRLSGHACSKLVED